MESKGFSMTISKFLHQICNRYIQQINLSAVMCDKCTLTYQVALSEGYPCELSDIASKTQ